MALILSVLCILQFREDFASLIYWYADAGGGHQTECKGGITH